MLLEENVLKDIGGGINNEALILKAKHLMAENNSLRQTVKDFQTQLISLRTVNQELQRSSPKTVQILIDNLSRQNLNLQNSLFRLIRNNEELSCDILMKNQLMVETENEYRQMINNYESKIYELRVSLQGKESYVATLEEKELMERDQNYNVPTKSNILYFNEANDTKLLLEKYMLENSQLQLAFLNQSQELETLQARLKRCQDLLKTKQEWKSYSKSLSTTLQVEKTAKMLESRNKIEQELTRYENRYKYIKMAWQKHGKSELTHQVYQLRLFITKLFTQKWTVDQQKIKLNKQLTSKQSQIRDLRESNKKLERQLKQLNVELLFYRQNFKELAKVSTERKIRFFDQHYWKPVPKLQKMLHQRLSLISYWKTWYEINQDKWPIIERRMLYKKKKKETNKRKSNSCGGVRFTHKEKSGKRLLHKQSDISMRESNIFSFINGEHEANTMLGVTFEVPLDETSRDEKLFGGDEQISIIAKPEKTGKPERREKKVHSPFKKKTSGTLQNI